MMKFFRKHNKKLLAIFMALLMVVFLGGSALDSLLRPSGDRIVANSNVGNIGFMDHRVAENTTSILNSIGLNWQRPLSGIAEPLETIDWILLTREAEQLGMTTNQTMLRSSFADQFRIDAIARQLRVKPDQVWRAMAEYNSIQQTALAIGGATAPSEAEVLSAARKVLEKVQIEAVLLPGRMFVDQDAGFTEAQLDEQFTAYREREPGEGLEFGYYVPPAVKVQYVKIDTDAITEQIGIANLEEKAKAYFEEYRERDPVFRKPPEEIAAEADPADETLEGPPYKPSPYLTWEKAAETAIEAVRNQEADEAASRIASWLADYTAEAWLGEVRGEDGYKTAPEHVAKLDYYDNIKIPRDIAYSDAVSTGTTDFFSEEEANEVPLLGQAYFQADRGVRQTLRTLAFRTQGIVPIIPNDRNVNPLDYLAMFQTCRYPLTDPGGSVHIIRVIDAREGHVPDSIDEVRERVLGDLRLQQGYETAKARAESLRSCTSSITLQGAYESDLELVALKDTEQGAGSGFFEPPPFGRASLYQAAAGRTTPTTYIGGGVGPVPIEIMEECFALADADDKTKVIELKEQARVMVVTWVDTQPGHADDFEDMRVSFVQQMSSARLQAAIADWLNPEQIRARNRFELVTD
ncbi:MAG: hypothetical protein WBE26_18825 [Phycisphaerae bacterium]